LHLLIYRLPNQHPPDQHLPDQQHEPEPDEPVCDPTLLPSLQPHVGSSPVNQLVIIATAQPVPALTPIASAGQFIAHAPHSIQESMSSISAFFSTMSNTP